MSPSLCIHWSELMTMEGCRRWISLWPPWYEMLYQTMTYFTMWTTIVTMIVEMNDLYQYDRIARTCFIMNVQSCMGGFYICHVYPRRLTVPYARLRLDGCTLVAADMLTHTMPFVFVSYRVMHKIRSMCFHDVVDILPILLYLLCFDINEKYELGVLDIVHLGIIFLMIMTGIKMIY